MITQQEVKDLFDYKDGFLYWKKRISIRCIFGKPVGTIRIDRSGQRRITSIYGKKYMVYRIIFLWHHGYMPSIVDHINRNPFDDRIENLREASIRQNSCNSRSRIGSGSKYKGVSFAKEKSKWHAQIQTSGLQKHIGYYLTEKEAAIAYNNEAEKIHGEFANLNKIELI